MSPDQLTSVIVAILTGLGSAYGAYIVTTRRQRPFEDGVSKLRAEMRVLREEKVQAERERNDFAHRLQEVNDRLDQALVIIRRNSDTQRVAERVIANLHGRLDEQSRVYGGQVAAFQKQIVDLQGALQVEVLRKGTLAARLEAANAEVAKLVGRVHDLEGEVRRLEMEVKMDIKSRPLAGIGDR